MTESGDIPELEPLEESAAAAPAAAAAPQAAPVTPVSLSGMPAPAFGARAQREYYRFFFAGVVMFLGCMMPFGPEAALVGYKTLGGSLFTLIALGIMWTSWVAITHGKFDLSSMRWLFLATIPLTVMIYHLIYIFEEPAVVGYISNAESKSVITDWGLFFDRLIHVKTTAYSNSLDDFIRAYGAGKIVLLFGSLFAVMGLIKGVGSGVKAGKQQKMARDAERSARKKR